jgi:RNA polymerase sigma factor (sigma-70 family)
MSHDSGPGKRRSDAAAEVLLREKTSLERFIRKHVRHPEDAKEIAQEVRTRFLEASKEGTPRDAAYLHGIADNVIHTHWRNSTRPRRFLGQQVAEDFANEVSDGQPDPESEEDSRRTNELLRQAIAALDPVQRAMILLKYHEGLTVREAGHRLRLSKAKADRVLHDARESIREFLESREGSDQ